MIPRPRPSPRTWTACRASAPPSRWRATSTASATFAESANRARGGRRLAAVAVVVLLLVGVAYVVWEALVFMLTALL
jgi:hypothetical protein